MGVTPFIVFDGLPLQAKENENSRRRRYFSKQSELFARLIVYISSFFYIFLFKNSDGEKRYQKAQEPGLSNTEKNKLLGQSVNITYDDVVECIKV